MIPEQRLMQSIVLRAIQDATAPDPKVEVDILAKRAADEWLRRGGRDFRMICSAGGLDPDFVRESYIGGRIDAGRLRGRDSEE